MNKRQHESNIFSSAKHSGCFCDTVELCVCVCVCVCPRPFHFWHWFKNQIVACDCAPACQSRVLLFRVVNLWERKGI